MCRCSEKLTFLRGYQAHTPLQLKLFSFLSTKSFISQEKLFFLRNLLCKKLIHIYSSTIFFFLEMVYVGIRITIFSWKTQWISFINYPIERLNWPWNCHALSSFLDCLPLLWWKLNSSSFKFNNKSKGRKSTRIKKKVLRYNWTENLYKIPEGKFNFRNV